MRFDLRRELARRLRELFTVTVKEHLKASCELVSKRGSFHRLTLCTVRATFIVGLGPTKRAVVAYEAQHSPHHRRRLAHRSLRPACADVTGTCDARRMLRRFLMSSVLMWSVIAMILGFAVAGFIAAESVHSRFHH